MKKFISVLLASLMVLATLTVSAASAVTVNPADVDLSTKSVTITGTGTANSSFILLVTNPGKTQTDTDLAGSAVQNVREVKIDANGEFIYKFTLYSATEGQYKVYADGVEKQAFNFAVASLTTDTQAILTAARANDLDAFTAKVTDPAVLATFSIDKYEPLISAEIALDMETYASKLLAAVRAADAEGKFAGTDAQNGAALQLIIKKVAALELLNQGKAAAYSFNTDGTFKYDSALKVSGIDAKYGISVYEYYAEGTEKDGKKYTLSSEGKAQVQNALLNKAFADEEDLYDAFIDAVICNGANKSTQKDSTSYSGYSHIDALFTSANKTKAGVTGSITEYIAKNLAGYGSAITTIEGLNGLIAGFAQAESEAGSGSGVTGGGGGGGGGGVAPGVSAGGTAVIPDKIGDKDALNQNNQNQTNIYKYKFDDIASVEWAVDAIEYLYTKGIVNGKADRVFDPNGTVTREEIVKMISIAVGLTEEAEVAFADVDSASWAKPFIAKAVKAGVISGIGENMFGFGQPVTRQDIAAMIYRTMPVKEIMTPALFTDKNEIADYAIEPVNVLAELKIINGFEDNTFRPTDSCTRAQAAVIIYNYLKTSGLAN